MFLRFFFCINRTSDCEFLFETLSMQIVLDHNCLNFKSNCVIYVVRMFRNPFYFVLNSALLKWNIPLWNKWLKSKVEIVHSKKLDWNLWARWMNRRHFFRIFISYVQFVYCLLLTTSIQTNYSNLNSQTTYCNIRADVLQVISQI